MKTLFKQFAESDTRLARSHFDRATIRLTLYYALGVAVLIAVLSVAVYGFFSKGISSQQQQMIIDHATVEGTFYEEVKENLLNSIMIADLLLLTLTIIVGYALSRKTLRPLEDIYQQQKRFLADAAHELRTPLAVIKAGAEVVLGKERTIAEYTAYVHDTLGEANRLIDLSNNLLALARYTDHAGARSNEKYFTIIDLSAVCNKACTAMGAYAQTNTITITHKLDPSIQILGNADDVYRLVINLLKNAIDYNVPRGNVSVSLTRHGKSVQLSISDTGKGIAEKDLPYIFERFYKADDARTAVGTSGTGLGLALVKEIVAHHKGTIQVTSSVGKGTTFTIHFPCA